MSKRLDFEGKWGATVRNMYQASSDQVVDGTKLTPEDVRIRAMNFGQHWRTEAVQNFPYCVKLPLPYVIDFLNTQLEEYVADAKADRDEDDEMDNLLMRHGWPTDAAFLLKNSSKRLIYLLMDFFSFDLLLHWYTDGQAPKNGAMINSCLDFEVNPEYLIITGQCRKSGFPVKYQDL